LKVTAFLLGLHFGFIQFRCFLYEQGSRAKDLHYFVISTWIKNIRNEPLVHPKKILLSPFHTKLGMTKISVKAMDHEKKALQYLKLKFPQINESKINDGICVGSQIIGITKGKKEIQMQCSNEPKNLLGKHLMHLLTNFLANIRYPTTGHMLTQCVKPSEMWDATCHSNCTSCTVIWLYFLANLEKSVTSRVRDFTKISPPQKNATKLNRIQHCLPTTIGNLKETPVKYMRKDGVKKFSFRQEMFTLV
jgi:hypothetical protein